ncbi:MAG: acetylserotonin O-methyltransferase [Candidatus Hydrogenedentes bacterium]|nr:acetylserotonin O-methyltransferase [Candidatus Hydrogenedentota bacterium]
MEYSKILETVWGFRESRVLLTAVELDLFTLLSDERLSLQEICKKLDSDTRATQYLLDALSAMGFLMKENDRYIVAPEFSMYLSKDSTESIIPILEHSANLWQRWSQLTDIVKGRMITIKPVEEMSPEQLRSFILGMHVLAKRVSKQLLSKLGPVSFKRMLDVGGATGTYTEAFLSINPEMRGTIFDLPPVIELAKERLKDSPYFSRIDFVSGDYYKDDLPMGYDFIWLSAVIHQNSREQNVELYRKCHSSLEKGGIVWIRDYVMSSDRTYPKAGALFAINMLVATQGGGTYTFEEIEEDLQKAGFEKIHYKIKGEQMDTVIEAIKE